MHSVHDKNGFSLIEILVVAAIIGVLAAISIPMYIGYINDQRQTTVNNIAETAAATANTYWRRTGTSLTDGDITPKTQPLNLYFNATNYTVNVTGTQIKVTDKKKTSITATIASYK